MHEYEIEKRFIQNITSQAESGEIQTLVQSFETKMNYIQLLSSFLNMQMAQYQNMV